MIVRGLLAVAIPLAALAVAGPAPAHPRVRVETSKGAFVIELAEDKAPATVANFLAYVRSGFYDGTIFHRVIPDFMIQGGGLTAALDRKPTRPPIANEAGNGMSNLRGTVAMARTSDVNSATSQFFVNLVDNTFLDHRDDSPRGFGYCVFGRVVEGMDVVDTIAAVPTHQAHGMADVPVEPVVIDHITVEGSAK